MTSPTRRLVVLRHAQAEPAADTDAGRALTPRGLEDARAAGRWLAGHGVDLDAAGAALVSAARRTRQTYEQLAAGAGWTTAATHDEGLYAAGPEAALDLVRAVDDDVRTLLVVGHNPTMGYLAQVLDDGGGDETATTELVSGGYPTCAAAVFAVERPWSTLEEAGARLEAFHVGRG